MDHKEEYALVDQSEEDSITRQILVWLNTCPELPTELVTYEGIQPKQEILCLSVIPGVRIISQNIIGGYTAECQFTLIYRVKPDGSPDVRLSADETLESIARWAKRNPPKLGDSILTQAVTVQSRAAVNVQFQDGDEDHTITLAVQYYVPPEL